MKIKLVALDMDGTTLNSKVRLAAKTRSTIEKAMEAGAYVVPCSGRVFSQLPKEILALNGLNYVITSNGARVMDLSDYNRVLYENPIPADMRKKIRGIIDPADVMVELYLSGKTYAEKQVLDNLGDFGVPEVYFSLFREACLPVGSHEIFMDMLENGDVEKINLFCPSPEVKEALYRDINEGCDVNITTSMETNMEINAATADKGDGLKHLAHTLGLTHESVMAVGDSNNDMAMLAYAGLSVAMGNASDAVKEAADVVTATNDDFGVAKALEKYVIGEEIGGTRR